MEGDRDPPSNPSPDDGGAPLISNPRPPQISPLPAPQEEPDYIPSLTEDGFASFLTFDQNPPPYDGPDGSFTDPEYVRLRAFGTEQQPRCCCLSRRNCGILLVVLGLVVAIFGVVLPLVLPLCGVSIGKSSTHTPSTAQTRPAPAAAGGAAAGGTAGTGGVSAGGGVVEKIDPEKVKEELEETKEEIVKARAELAEAKKAKAEKRSALQDAKTPEEKTAAEAEVKAKHHAVGASQGKLFDLLQRARHLRDVAAGHADGHAVEGGLGHDHGEEAPVKKVEVRFLSPPGTSGVAPSRLETVHEYTEMKHVPATDVIRLPFLDDGVGIEETIPGDSAAVAEGGGLKTGASAKGFLQKRSSSPVRVRGLQPWGFLQTKRVTSRQRRNLRGGHTASVSYDPVGHIDEEMPDGRSSLRKSRAAGAFLEKQASAREAAAGATSPTSTITAASDGEPPAGVVDADREPHVSAVPQGIPMDEGSTRFYADCAKKMDTKASAVVVIEDHELEALRARREFTTQGVTWIQAAELPDEEPPSFEVTELATLGKELCKSAIDLTLFFHRNLPEAVGGEHPHHVDLPGTASDIWHEAWLNLMKSPEKDKDAGPTAEKAEEAKLVDKGSPVERLVGSTHAAKAKEALEAFRGTTISSGGEDGLLLTAAARVESQTFRDYLLDHIVSPLIPDLVMGEDARQVLMPAEYAAQRFGTASTAPLVAGSYTRESIVINSFWKHGRNKYESLHTDVSIKGSPLLGANTWMRDILHVPGLMHIDKELALDGRFGVLGYFAQLLAKNEDFPHMESLFTESEKVRQAAVMCGMKNVWPNDGGESATSSAPGSTGSDASSESAASVLSSSTQSSFGKRAGGGLCGSYFDNLRDKDSKPTEAADAASTAFLHIICLRATGFGPEVPRSFLLSLKEIGVTEHADIPGSLVVFFYYVASLFLIKGGDDLAGVKKHIIKDVGELSGALVSNIKKMVPQLLSEDFRGKVGKWVEEHVVGGFARGFWDAWTKDAASDSEDGGKATQRSQWRCFWQRLRFVDSLNVRQDLTVTDAAHAGAAPAMHAPVAVVGPKAHAHAPKEPQKERFWPGDSAIHHTPAEYWVKPQRMYFGETMVTSGVSTFRQQVALPSKHHQESLGIESRVLVVDVCLNAELKDCWPAMPQATDEGVPLSAGAGDEGSEEAAETGSGSAV
ncbi:unnamed protein product, partial [Amoebophrya sp. A25]|eukprot:GSA25T00009100001.1